MNHEKVDWSSLSNTSKATQTEYTAHEVNVITLKSILDEEDDVYYIKLDIEGGELNALKSIDQCKLPRFISVENNFDRLDMIRKLVKLGYSEFMLVRQGTDFFKTKISVQRRSFL